jgi:hypothetical protein
MTIAQIQYQKKIKFHVITCIILFDFEQTMNSKDGEGKYVPKSL